MRAEKAVVSGQWTVGREDADVIRALRLPPSAFVRSRPSRHLADSYCPCPGRRKEPPPRELVDVGITELPGARLPLELPFVDSDGRKTTLGQFFDGAHPVILTMNYSDCPMLCSIQLNGLVDAMKAMPWNLGEQFSVITVSIDPLETPMRAALTKEKYLKTLQSAGQRRRLAFSHRQGREHQEAGRHGGIPLQVHRGLEAICPCRGIDPLHARRARVALSWAECSTIRKRCGCRWSRPPRARSARASISSSSPVFIMTRGRAATGRSPWE